MNIDVYNSIGSLSLTASESPLEASSASKTVRFQLQVFGTKDKFIPFDAFSSKLLQNRSVTAFAVEQLPKLLGSGNMGRVYELEGDAKERTVFKLLSKFFEVALAPEKRLKGSFKNTVTVAKQYLKLPQSSCIPKFYGIIYVQSLNLWGPIYEHIDGDHLPEKFTSVQKLIDVMKKLLQALKFLDEQGHPYTDIKKSNIMIRKADHSLVIIDDPVETSGMNRDSKYSKILFRYLFSDYLKGFKSSLKVNKAREIIAAWENSDELSWDSMRNSLESKEFAEQPMKA